MSQLEIQADVTQEMQANPLAGLGLAPLPAQNEDPFQGLGLAKTPERTPDQARLALNFRAGKMTPEQAQEAYALTRKTNLPQSAVLNDTARVREMLEEHDLDAFGNDAPLAASWMAADVIRTNIARDDTASLKGLEGVLQKRPGVMELAGQSYEANTQYLDDLNLWGRHMGGERSPELDSAMKEADQRMKTYAQSVPKQLGLGEEFVVNTAEQLPIQLSILKERGKGYLVGPSVGAFVGSVVPGVGTLAGAGAGLFAGPAAYSASEAYKLESVSAYREFRQGGIPDEAAAIASRAYGVAASVVEFADSIIDTSIIFGGALNPVSKAATKMTIKSAMLGFMKNVGIGKATESAEEAIQQGLQVGIGELAKLTTDTESDTTWQGALEEMGTAAWKTLWSAWGAESAVPRFALDVNAARQGGGASYIRDAALATGQKNEQELLASIDDLSANSKLAQRAPQLYEEAVRSMNQDGAVKNVHIPAGGFVAAFGGIESIITPGSEQAARITAVLDTLGVLPDIFASSLASGADIVVPIEKYAATVAQDKEFATLIANDRRLTEDGFTVRELDQWKRDTKGALASYITEVQTSQQAATQFEQESAEIFQATQQQLEAAGLPREEAAANATQVSAFFGTMAQRTDMTPLQLWGTYAPDVQMEGERLVEAGGALFTPVTSSQQNALAARLDFTVLEQPQPQDMGENGVSVVGRVTPEIALKLPLNKAGDICLDAEGLAHIEEEHGQQIRDRGFADARTFVNHVLSNVDAIYQGKTNRTFEIVTISENPNGRIVARLEFEEDGDIYRIKTAGPIKNAYYKNKPPLWERAHPALFHEENPLATRRASQRGQSEGSLKIIQGENAGVNARGRINFSESGMPHGDAVLKRDAAVWGLEVANIVASGKVPSSPVPMLTQTPLVMQMLGAKERPVYVAPHLFDGTHPNITPAMLKGLPQALADPIAIFQSKTHKDRLVFMLEMTDASGATVVVPVHLDGTKDRTTIHIATTVYAKNKQGLPDNEWFVKQAGNALYINRQKEKRWIMSSGSNSLWDASSTFSNINIRTETDLVNLRQQNPGMYAGGQESPRGRILLSTPSGRPLITLFQQADASTFLHESGHNYLEILRALGTSQNAVPEIAALWQQARDILNETAGVDAVTDAQISTAAHELWASSLENYFMKGQAPSLELRSVFAKFSAWLKALYNQWRSLGVQPSEELNEIFKRMFATDEQIAEVNAWHESSGKLAKMLARSKDGQSAQLAQMQAKAIQEAKDTRFAKLSAAYTQAQRDTAANEPAADSAIPADAEYHSNAQLAVLLAQRQVLAQRAHGEGKPENQHDVRLEVRALRDAARAATAAMPAQQVMQAHRHSLAERRAARNAWEAAQDGRWEHAAEYKRQEAFSHAMYLAAISEGKSFVQLHAAVD